ncbi:MAG TPA: YeeE/YedE thiosulfate transporter family protein [Geobacteraceae bacterium]
MADTAYAYIIPSSLILGTITGFVMHRADFCLAGALRNLCLFRDAALLRATALLVAAAMALFEAGRLAGILPGLPFPLLGPASLATATGGALFGVGMVLAGGCVAGSLYRLGSGSFLSLLAVMGLVAGSALYAEIHPWWQVLQRETTLFADSLTIPQLAGCDPAFVTVPTLVVGSVFLCRWWRAGLFHRRAHAEGYLQPWKAALVLAAVSFASTLVVGMPLGIATTYAKIGGYIEEFLMPGHFAGLSFFRAIPLDYLPPFGGSRLTGGPGPELDAIAAIQFPLIAGIVGGGAVSAVLLGEFGAWRRAPWRQQVSALAGGIIMGLASRMASGCNVWHVLGGLPILALQSIVFCLALLPGAWVGSRILVRAVIRT